MKNPPPPNPQKLAESVREFAASKISTNRILILLLIGWSVFAAVAFVVAEARAEYRFQNHFHQKIQQPERL